MDLNSFHFNMTFSILLAIWVWCWINVRSVWGQVSANWMHCIQSSKIGNKLKHVNRKSTPTASFQCKWITSGRGRSYRKYFPICYFFLSKNEGMSDSFYIRKTRQDVSIFVWIQGTGNEVMLFMELITKLKIGARYKVKYNNPKLVFRMLGVPTWDMHQKSKKLEGFTLQINKLVEKVCQM